MYVYILYNTFNNKHGWLLLYYIHCDHVILPLGNGTAVHSLPEGLPTHYMYMYYNLAGLGILSKYHMSEKVISFELALLLKYMYHFFGSVVGTIFV